MYTNAETGGLFANGDTLTGSATGATGTIVDIATVTDEILGSQSKIFYTPVTLVFNPGTDSITNGTATATFDISAPAILDEIANATEATASDINLTVTRSVSSSEFNLQIEPGAIVNADVNASAAIAQSKLNLNAATTRANATGISQSDLGVAAFDDDDFSITDGWVTLKTNNVDFDDLPQIGNMKRLLEQIPLAMQVQYHC